MIISYWFICAFALLINICTAFTVHPQIRVDGAVRGSVVLPCSSSEDELKIQDINVRWRHNSLNMYEIVGGRDLIEKQNSVYKNRTETFPEEYEKGNFSLKLNNLTHTDAGNYQCFIIHSSELVTVQLNINESTEANEKQPAAAEGNKAGETILMWMKIFIPVLCVFLLLCISFCIAYIIRKRADKTSSSSCLACRVWHQLSSNTSSDTSEPDNQEHTELQTKA